MVEEIIWSPIAIETFDNILNYLSANFGEKSVKVFVQKVDAKLKLIQSRPRMLGVVARVRILTSLLLIAKQLLLTDIKKLEIKLNLSFFGECKILHLNQSNSIHLF